MTALQKSDGQTGHTPGPWAFDRETGEVYYDDGDVSPLIATVGHDGETVSFEQACADMALIAAAPDFAGVAPDAADLLDEYSAYIRTVKADELERHPYLPEIERVASDLRAAIAKATSQ